MVFGTLNGFLDGVARSARHLFQPQRRSPSGPSKEMRRPAVFSLLFWSTLAASYLFGALDLAVGGWGVGFVPATLGTLVLAASWLLLPWDPRTERTTKLLAPAFLAVAFAVGQLFGSVWWTLMFYALAVANGAFLFGLRLVIAYAGMVLAAVFTHALVSGETVGNTLALAAIFVFVAAFFVGVCSAILDAEARRQETQALLEKLEDAHAELERYATRVRELTLAEERARMSREMHDSVGHYLTAVNFQLEAAAKAAEGEQSKAVGPLRRARKFADEAFLEVRRSVRALGPPPAEERSGAGAMAALARSFEGTGLEARFAVEGEERDLTEEAELALYRALQEGLSNAARHSGARVVLVTLAYEPTGAKLVVADDGKGVIGEASGGAVAKKCGFGLPALKETTEVLGGVFSANNSPEGGFVLKVWLPTDRPTGRANGKPSDTPTNGRASS